MALTALLKISGASGESRLSTTEDPNAGGKVSNGSYKGWIELQGWDWDVEAETSWTKGGGASVGKPNPGKMNWEHYFDTSSTVIMGYICTGKAFPKVELQMMKTTGSATPETYYTMTMEGAFITKVSNKGGEDGSVSQDVEMVYKQIILGYKQQKNDGKLGGTKPFAWNIGTMNKTTTVKLSI